MQLNQGKIGSKKIIGFSRKRVGSCNSCHTASKKLIIKNFELPKPIDQHECWPKLERAVRSILNHELANGNSENNMPSLEELYTAVQNLCSRNKSHGEETYQKLKDLINVYVRETMLLSILGDNDQPLLTILEQTWDSYCVKMRMIRNIFLCLDRVYVLSTPRLISIWDMCLEMFRKEIIFHEQVLHRLLHSLLQVIASERENTSTQQASRIQMRNIMRMMVDLDIYESLFEPKFLQESKGYYNAQATRKLRFVEITINTIVSYLDFVADKLKEEELRVIDYGLAMTSTSKKIEKIIEKELLESHLDLLINNTIELLFVDKSNLRHIKLAFQLFSRVPNATSRLCSCFNVFVKNSGKALLNLASSDPEKDKTLIKDLLDFKDLMDLIVRECLNSNERFSNTLKDAFETFVNIRTNKVAELIAKHVDGILRDSIKLEDSFDQQIDKVLVLFRFIHGKDIFEAFYQRDLSKRLLGGKSASVDAEKLVLMKLKQECGGAFTSKLEAMFKDMELSRELTTSFKMHIEKAENAKLNTKYPIDLSVSVLTTGIWPTYQPIELILSEDLRQYEDVFREFYLAKHTGRKLTWQHCFDHCLLKAQFGVGDKARDKELQVSFIQALVLLEFNKKTDFTYKEIRASILPNKLEGTEESELKRTLQSLSMGKIRVLTKNPKGRDVLDTDSFTLDDNFDHKLFRLKINQVQWKETYEESVNTQEKVNQDRQYQLDAAAVRIMKARKTMLHAALVNEIYDKVNFPASSTETKKRIDSLIERDYLRRDKDNPNLYHYVA